MEKTGFTIADALKYGWDAFIKNGAMLFGVYLIYSVIYGGLMLIAELFFSDNFFTYQMIKMTNLFILLIFSMFLENITLVVYEKGQPILEDFWVLLTWRKFWYYIAVTFISVIAMMIGLVLLIIPGIIIMLKLQFASYFVIRDGLPPIKALRASWNITFDEVLHLLGFGFVVFGLGILGMLCCCVGSLVTTPISMLATVYVFIKLCDQEKAINDHLALGAADIES